jgi:hypothetical protein
MTLSGVRISWLVLARKADFRRVDSSAASRALGQLEVGCAALADVAQDRYHAHADTQIDHHRGEQRGHRPAITGAQIGFEVAERPALEDLAREAAIILRIREQREPLRVPAQRLLMAVAVDAAKRAVDVDDSAVVGGRDHDRVVNAVEDIVKAPLAIA